MPKLTWTVRNTTTSTDITYLVRSINLPFGRPSPLSPYSGNSATITLTNYGGTNDLVNIQERIGINVYVDNEPTKQIFYGVITSRIYDDNPGTGVNSTMTIIVNDYMLEAGMANFVNQSLVDVNDQLNEISLALPQFSLDADLTSVNISTGTFNVNVAQRVNEIVSADRGILKWTQNPFDPLEFIYETPRQFKRENEFTIGSTISATQIAYQNLVRVEAASNSLFYTQATVTGSASTVTKSSAALATYGTRTFTVTTAQSNLVSETAEWYANAFSDPYAETLIMSFTDIAQNNLALIELAEFIVRGGFFIEVFYTPPGETEISGYFYPDQMVFNVTPAQTTIDFVMTPLTYYANFILDNVVFGVLDIDRLGVS